MCERRTRQIKKGTHLTRLRETRRLQRMQRVMSPPPPIAEEPVAPCPPAPVDNNAQCRLILELALKTIGLMQKNSMIQQKIIDLQKETSEYFASVMSNPANKQRYLEHIRLHGQPCQAQAHHLPTDTHVTNITSK